MQDRTPNIIDIRIQMLVCVKPVGVLSEPANGRGMPDLLRAAYQAAGKPDFIAGVHRLDKNVGGLMVFSRNPAATGKLTGQIAQRTMRKEYLAILRGCPEQPEGTLEDLLFHDASHNKTYVVKRMRRGVRDARLSYRQLAQTEAHGQTLTLVQILLHTGRTHQIRAQFSSRQLPLLGDIRYGSKDPNCDVALWACRLTLAHPKTRKPMQFVQLPPACYPWTLFPAVQLTDWADTD